MISSKFFQIRNWALKHKKTSIVLILILAIVGYKIFQNTTSQTGQVQYITSAVEKGTIVSSITGTGQVSASNQVDITSEVSGDITSLPVKLGQAVSGGQIIARIDASDASRAVQNAELGLENAKIAYDKSLKQSNDQASDSNISDLKKAYDDGYTAVANTFINVPDILNNVGLIFYEPTHSPYFGDINVRNDAGETAINYKYEAGRVFDQVKKDYEADFKSYKAIGAKEDLDKMIALINQTYDMTKKLSSSITATYNTIDYIKTHLSNEDVPAQMATDKSDLSSYITKVNNNSTALSNALTAIEDAKDSATTATLDLKSAQINLSGAEDTLKKANEDLYNHSVRTPFAGIIAKIAVENGDKANVGTSIATLITDQKIAEVSLNEVDISKVKVGQKATLTFDAIDGLTITGTVTEVDLLGAVNQGVVSYTVKVAFDVNDDRVKTGMSLSAAIVNETKQDVLRVLNSAVKSQNNSSYVEALDSNGAVTQIPIETGLSNDEYTEVLSGLNEGEQIISRTVVATTASATTQAPSLFGSSANRATGGAARQLGR